MSSRQRSNSLCDIKRDNQNRIPAFVDKLWALVDSPETDPLIAWTPDGDAFLIRDPNLFSHELLPMYYKHNHMQSFVRMLNMYGFHKVTSADAGALAHVGQDEVEFKHPFFQRGRRDLLVKIERKHTQAKLMPSSGKPEVINKILDEVKKIKGKQTVLEQQMMECFQENREMCNEMSSLRKRCTQQSVIINKLLQFFIGYNQDPPLPAAEASSANPQKRAAADPPDQLALPSSEEVAAAAAFAFSPKRPRANSMPHHISDPNALRAAMLLQQQQQMPAPPSLRISEVTHDPLLSTAGVGGELGAAPSRAASSPKAMIFHPPDEEEVAAAGPAKTYDEDYNNMARNLQDLIDESCSTSSQEALFPDRDVGPTLASPALAEVQRGPSVSPAGAEGGKLWSVPELAPHADSIKKDLEDLEVSMRRTLVSDGGGLTSARRPHPQGIISCDQRGLGAHHEAGKLRSLFDPAAPLRDSLPDTRAPGLANLRIKRGTADEELPTNVGAFQVPFTPHSLEDILEPETPQPLSGASRMAAPRKKPQPMETEGSLDTPTGEFRRSPFEFQFDVKPE